MKCFTAPYEGDKDYIFFSYCHKDAARVYPIIERLTMEGFRVWYDSGIHPGDDWPEVIAGHLERASAVVASFSMASVESHNCRNEVTYAVGNNKSLVSVVLEDVKMPRGMKMQLSSSQVIRPYEARDMERFYAELLAFPALEKCRDPNRRAGLADMELWQRHVREYQEAGNEKTTSVNTDNGFLDWLHEERDQDEKRRRREEEERKRREEEERRRREEEERKRREEEERRQREEESEDYDGEKTVSKWGRPPKKELLQPDSEATVRVERETEETKRKRLEAEEAERKRLEAEAELKRLAAEAERKKLAAEEAERKRREEAERKRREEEERKRREEEERKRREEEERKRREEEERKRREEEERKRREEEERKRREEEERKRREEEERKRREEEEQKRLQEEELRKREAEEAERRRQISIERRKMAEREAEAQKRAGFDISGEDTVVDPGEVTIKGPNPEDTVKDGGADGPTIRPDPLIPAILYRKATGEVFPLEKKHVVLGRSQDRADVVLDGNREISRRHAEVIQRDKKLYLKDLGSTFGTEINGSQVDSEELVELGSAAAVSMGGEEFMILSGTWVRDAMKRDRIGLLKSIRTGEVKPLTSKRFPLDRSHMWDGEVLSSRLISRRAQTEIECSDGEFLVKDLDSPNGTFLNGEKLTGRAERLYDGDEISVADEKFVFLEISIKKRGYLI